MRAGATMYDAEGGEDTAMQQDARDTRLTYDEFLLFPADGRHYVTPSPNTGHQVLVGRLYFEIALFLRAHPGLGEVFPSPLDVVFTTWDVVAPDLLFVAADQQGIITDTNVQGAPALVVEI